MEVEWARKRSETWYRSSYCADGWCIEVAYAVGLIIVRDSKLGDDSPRIGLTPDTWAAFLRIAASWGRIWPACVDGMRLEATSDTVLLIGETTWLEVSIDAWAKFVAGVRRGEFAVERLAGAA